MPFSKGQKWMTIMANTTKCIAFFFFFSDLNKSVFFCTVICFESELCEIHLYKNCIPTEHKSLGLSKWHIWRLGFVTEVSVPTWCLSKVLKKYLGNRNESKCKASPNVSPVSLKHESEECTNSCHSTFSLEPAGVFSPSLPPGKPAGNSNHTHNL